MLAHLLSLDPEPLQSAASSFVPEDSAPAPTLLAAKINTADWLQSLNAEELPSATPGAQKMLAAPAFAAGLGLDGKTPEQARAAVLALKTPEAVKRAVSMLTAYEWQFVEHAQNIRSYIVAGLLDETKHTKPEVRLKAYKMLGEVTEVALFTQRSEVVTRDLSDAQIEEEIKRRLERLTVDVETKVLSRSDNDVDD
jgi:hypothetical protein